MTIIVVKFPPPPNILADDSMHLPATFFTITAQITSSAHHLTCFQLAFIIPCFPSQFCTVIQAYGLHYEHLLAIVCKTCVKTTCLIAQAKDEMVTTEPFRGAKRQKLKQVDRHEILRYRSLIFFEKMLMFIENNRVFDIFYTSGSAGAMNRYRKFSLRECGRERERSLSS